MSIINSSKIYDPQYNNTKIDRIISSGKIYYDRIFSDPNIADLIYSLRKINSFYTGPCIRVRRTDSDQADIGFIGIDLDVDALLAFVSGQNGYVTILYEQNGAGDSLTQSDPIKQPLIVQAGVLNTTPTLLPAMRFDGIDDYLIGVDNYGAIEDFSVYSVSQMILGGDDYGRLYGAQENIDNRLVYQQEAVTAVPEVIYPPDIEINPTLVDMTIYSQQTLIANSDGGKVWQDETLAGQTPTPTIATNIGERFSIGNRDQGTNSYYGDISEIFIFKKDTTSDRVSILNEQRDYWFSALSNLAIGYSLRKLRADYEGPGIRVRRVADDAELDIGYIGEDLDTASLLAFIGVGGEGRVTGFYDQGLTEQFAIYQPTAKKQGLIVDAGNLVIHDGSVAVYLDGIEDHYIRETEPGELPHDEMSAFFVLSPHDDGQSGMLFDYTAQGEYKFSLEDDSVLDELVYLTSVSITTPFTYGVTQQITIQSEQDGINATELYIDGSIRGTNTSNWLFGGTNSFMVIGAARNGVDRKEMFFKEMMLFDRTKIPATRSAIETDQKNYWNTP